MPKRLRYFLQRDADLQGAALRLFLRAVESCLPASTATATSVCRCERPLTGNFWGKHEWLEMASATLEFEHQRFDRRDRSSTPVSRPAVPQHLET